MLAEWQPDVWPWEWVWPIALSIASLVFLSLVVRFIRRRGFTGRRPWPRWIILAFALIVSIMPFFLYTDWPVQLWRAQSVAESSPQATKSDLRTRVFPLPPKFVFAEAVRVVQAMPSWRLTRQDADAGVISAEVSIALGLFTNDVLIHVGAITPGGAQVDVRVSARRPEGDLGTTEREIALFYRRLDAAIMNPER